MEDKLLSITEVSKYLKIPKSTIYKLSQKGKIPSSKIGRQLRFRLSSIDKWLSQMEGGRDLPRAGSGNILLVDDDALVLKSIAAFLTQHGHHVISAQTGRGALEFLKRHTCDLVVVDVRMPKMDGIETIKRMRALRRQQGRAQLPEVIITGYMDPEARARAQELGIANFIYKPFAVKDFSDKINELLQKC
jgi:excisionase family DNA binding protein